MKSQLYSAAKFLLDSTIGTLASWLPPLRPARQLASFAPPPTYQPTLPVNMVHLTGPLAQGFRQPVTYHEYHVAELANVFVSWDGAVFKNLRLFPGSIVHQRFIRRFQDTFLLRQWFGAKVRLPPSAPGVVVAHDQWSAGNYYHWLVDTLPRLLLVERAYPQHLLLLPAPLPPRHTPDYVTGSAKALGFSHFFSLNTRQILHARQVIVPELTAESLYQDPALIRRVREILLAKLSLVRSGRQRRIYASRSTQSVRRVANEDELLPLLLAQGFEIIHFEKLSFLEQVSLLNETSIFAGVHGANMTNLLFLPPGAAVVELLSAAHGDLCYFRLASCAGQPYYCVPCAPTHPELHNQSDLTVEVDFVARTLASLPPLAAQ